MRRRIVILATMAAVIATTLFGVPLAVFVGRGNWDNERTDLERVATASALAVANDLSGSATPQLPLVPTDVILGLYTPTGELRAGRGPSVADRTVQRATNGYIDATDAKDAIVIAIPIMDEGQLLGVMRAMKTHTTATANTISASLAMFGCAILAVALTWLLARRMAARLARPLEDLSVAAKVLGEGDFTVRARQSGVPEIDSVGTSLNNTAQRIGDTLDRERSFSANASHQLRTPLAGLRLQLEGALESPQDPRPAIRKGIDAIDRLDRTVNDLLSLARDENCAPVADLDALLADVEATWREPLASMGRSLEISVNGAPAPRAAEAGFRQILNVLVDNAFTHGSGTVRVLARDAGGALAVDVSDEGSGVQPGVDVFTRRADVHNGHGIGLALARSLAEADGGRLMHADGSTFTLLLPSAMESADPPP
ncbi:HAMP domain-containing histidine kinase [Kibdelosporangium philippinense]|uniref:histidine kinase n=1 Tax=Kibdelosporangium philippinense TaxID=211113 RepID=A0ABS8ZIN8_9PSEU|nr:HAMP domain-containing sensor histidine kinase [Kibdelosporangium philippinense]MCE7006805.1 HAMP domain-containing histidine kinase [Kibdelosporangium philippinense]